MLVRHRWSRQPMKSHNELRAQAEQSYIRLSIGLLKVTTNVRDIKDWLRISDCIFLPIAMRRIYEKSKF